MKWAELIIKRDTYKHALSASPEIGLQEDAEPLVELWGVHLRAEIPVEEMADLLALESSLQQESRQGTVVVGLKLQHLDDSHIRHPYSGAK